VQRDIHDLKIHVPDYTISVKIFVADINSLRTLLIQIERFGGKVPENILLILEDNREKSIDLSFFGMIDLEQVV